MAKSFKVSLKKKWQLLNIPPCGSHIERNLCGREREVPASDQLSFICLGPGIPLPPP
jgi:hypothetical protein